jgi:hypothetical protein
MTTPLLLLVATLVVLGFVLRSQTERFQPEFLDKRQVRRTVGTENSSYTQATNHLEMKPISMGPLEGVSTPFQVNQYRAHVV